MPHFKRIVSQIIFVSLVLILSGSLSNLAHAAQSIDSESSVPDGIFVGERSTITVSAHIEPDPNLISPTVNVIQYDAAGRAIAHLGKAFDDGTHGDALSGDNIFSRQLILNEARPTTIYLRISVRYTGPFNGTDPIRQLLSNVITIDVVIRPSEESVTAILGTNQQAAANLDNWIPQFGTSQARQMLINYLQSQSQVAKVGISSDGASVWAVYRNGLESVFPVNPL